MLAIDFQFETNDANRGTQTQKMSPIRNGTVVNGGILFIIYIYIYIYSSHNYSSNYYK